MKNLSENIFLGHTLLQHIKQQAISSNDLIPRADLPVIAPDMIQECISRFGKQKITQYLDYTKKAKIVRSTIMEKADALLHVKYRLAAGMLAIARMGYGEASELVNVAYVELIKRQLWNFTVVQIQSKPNQNSRHPHPFGHGFILLGCQDFLQNAQSHIPKIKQNHIFFSYANSLNKLYENIAKTEAEMELNPALRPLGIQQLTQLSAQLRQFKRDFFAQFPAARALGMEGFLKNATQVYDDFYQILFQSTDPNLVVLDPLLNFVGTLRDYVQEQQPYYSQFNYSKIMQITTENEMREFAADLPETTQAIEQLLSAPAIRDLQPCDRSLLDLPLCAYDHQAKTEIPQQDNPGAILALNMQGSLRFSGLYTEDYKLDAVTEVTSAQEMAEATAIQHRLQAGNFYRTSQQTFFVVPKVNIGEVCKKIEKAYWQAPGKC